MPSDPDAASADIDGRSCGISFTHEVIRTNDAIADKYRFIYLYNITSFSRLPLEHR
jgi:hypothetical protein